MDSTRANLQTKAFVAKRTLAVIFATLLSVLAGIMLVTLDVSTFWLLIFITILNILVSSGLIISSKSLFISHVTIPGYAFLTYVIVIDVPTLIFVLGNIQDSNLLLWKAVQGSTLLLAVGVMYGSLMFKLSDEEVKSFFSRPINFKYYDKAFQKVVQYGLVLAVLIMGLYFYKYGGRIPLIYLIRHPGDAFAISLLREETMKISLSFLEGYLYEWGRAFILPTLMSMSFVMWQLSKETQWRNWFILYLILAVSFASLSTAKFPVVMVLVILIFAYLIMSGVKGVLRKAPLFIILILAYPLFERIVKYRAGFIEALTFVFWERVFVIPTEALSLYFKYFPLQDGLLGGRSIRLVSIFIGKEYFNTANYVYVLRGTSRIDTGLANGAFIGNLYADFGMAGVMIGAFVIGFFIQWVQITFFRREKNALSVAIYAFLIVLFLKITIVPFPTLLLGSGGLAAWLIFLVTTPRIQSSKARGKRGGY